MEGKDNRLVGCKQHVILGIGKSMWMFLRWLQFEQVDNIDHTDLEIRQFFSQDGYGSKCLQRRCITGTSHDHIRFTSLVIACPVNDAKTLCAQVDCFFHGEPLRTRVLGSNHDIDIVAASQAVIHCTQQAVGIRRQIDAHHISLLVCNVVHEARILMGEAIVVLLPDMRCQDEVQ